LPNNKSGTIRKCEFCGKDFYIIKSRILRNGGKFCSNKCKGNAMRGNKHPLFGKKRSPETLVRMSEGMKGKNAGKKISPEAKEKMRISWTPERRIAQAIRMSGKNNPNYGKSSAIGSNWGNGSYFAYNDRKIWLRSSYETRVATVLTKIGIKWEYEPKSFSIPTDRTYTPDFYLPELDIWWEVKGYIRPEAKNKIGWFFLKYNKINLRVLYIDDILKLEKINSIEELKHIGTIYIGEDKMTLKLSQNITFSAAHRLLNYSGSCNNLHGHTWKVNVLIQSDRKLDSCGMLIDYRSIKQYFSEKFDHKTILNKEDPLLVPLQKLGMDILIVDSNPTAENIASIILYDFVNIIHLNKNDHITIRVHESEENYAEEYL